MMQEVAEEWQDMSGMEAAVGLFLAPQSGTGEYDPVLQQMEMAVGVSLGMLNLSLHPGRHLFAQIAA